MEYDLRYLPSEDDIKIDVKSREKVEQNSKDLINHCSRDQPAENKRCRRHWADLETEVKQSVHSGARHQSRLIASDHDVRTVIGTAAPASGVQLSHPCSPGGSRKRGSLGCADVQKLLLLQQKRAAAPDEGSRTSNGHPRPLQAHRSTSWRGEGAAVAVGDQECRGPFGPMHVKWKAYAYEWPKIGGARRALGGPGVPVRCAPARRWGGHGERKFANANWKACEICKISLAL